MNFFFLKHPSSSPESSQTDQRFVSRRFILYASLAGSVFSIIQFGEVIARKSLGASTLEVTFLTMTWPVASITSLWWARLLVGRDQRTILTLFGLFAYLALAGGFFLDSMGYMMSMYLLFFLATAMVIPAENRVFQQHIPAAKTGKLYGTAAGLRMGIAAATSAFAGWYMDKTDEGYQHLFLFAAAIGFISLRQLASVPTTGNGRIKPEPIDWSLITVPLKKVITLLKRRKDYLRFELAFMVYGIAFMMTLPVVPLFLVDDLQFGYTNIGFARGTIPQLVMVVFMPMFGRLFDRSTPHRFAVALFFGLAFYPLLLLSAKFFEGSLRVVMVYIAFGLFGFLMSGIMMLWSLSSLRFAEGEDAGVYHSVHVAATGVRGTFGPILGYVVMTTMGKSTALICASGLWIVASLTMFLMKRIDIRSGEARSLRAVPRDVEKTFPPIK